MGNRVIRAEQIMRHCYGSCYDSYPAQDPPPEVDKTKAIGELSRAELRDLLDRLRSERDAQQMIRDLKRYSGERDTFEKPMVTDSSTPINQLYHHGIPGQKWGVRRFQNKDGTRTAAGKKRDAEAEESARPKSADHIKSREDKRKGPSELSNEELKKLNERLQLERTYSSLTEAQVKQGQSMVGKALKDAASQAITDVAKNSMVAAAKLLIKEVSPSFAETAFKITDKNK